MKYHLVVKGLVVVSATRVALCFLPYRKLQELIPATTGKRCSIEYARRVAAAVATAARIVPSASCLTQALAAKYLLARSNHHSLIRVGACRTEIGGFEAHAWLVCDGVVVLGGPPEALARYTHLVDLE